MKDLIEFLSDFPEINPNNYGDDEVNALNAWSITAHTALEQQAEEIERLKLRLKMTSDTMNGYMLERNALQAKLSAMESQEPVAWAFKVNKFHRHVEFYCPSDDGYDEGTLQPLYTAPKVAKLSDDQIQDLLIAFRGGADWSDDDFDTAERFVRAIEAAIGGQ